MTCCEEYAALLDLFVDGELATEEMTRVRNHLETCPGCRSYVDDVLAIRAAFPGVEDTEVPEGFAESVMERIRADAAAGELKDRKDRKNRKNSRRRWAGTLTALAACFAVALLVQGVPRDANDSAAPAGDVAPALYEAGAPEAQSGTGGTDDMEAAPAGTGDTNDMEAAPAEPSESPVQARTASGGERPEMSGFAADGDGQSGKRYNSSIEQNEEEGAAAGVDSAAADRTVPSLAAAPQFIAPEPEDEEPENPAAPELPADAGAGLESGREAALYLTQEEADGLLDGFAPIWEDGTERRYELTAEELRVLLTALGRLEELEAVKVESGAETFPVVVTHTGE